MANNFWMLARITSHKKSQICIHGVHQNFVFVARPICPQCFSLKNIPVLKTTKKFSPVLPTAKIGIPSFYTGRGVVEEFSVRKTYIHFRAQETSLFRKIMIFFILFIEKRSKSAIKVWQSKYIPFTMKTKIKNDYFSENSGFLGHVCHTEKLSYYRICVKKWVLSAQQQKKRRRCFQAHGLR